MATQIEIVNRALIEMGKDPIASMEDSVEAARVMKSTFNLARDATLSLSNWGFAGAVAKLPKSSNRVTNDFRYENVYPLPGEFVKLRQLLPPNVAYRLTGDAIFANGGPPLVISYTQRVAEINRWPPLVQEVLSARLAVATALKLTGHRSTRKTMLDWLETILAEARHVHSQEHSQEDLNDDIWLAARRQLG